MSFTLYPFFFLAIGLELIVDRVKRTGYYRANDSINSLSLGVISTTSKLVVLDIAGRVYAWLQGDFSLQQWQSVQLWQYVLAFVLYDACYYWFHRISHQRKLFWAAHVAHHQSEEYNLTTALRQTSTSFLLAWIFYIPCFALGMPAEVFVTVASLNLIYQFWVHTRFIPELGPLEYLLVTPSNHRVHHARNPVYVDKNYGGVFIVWDRLFGSYTPERVDTPVDYGISSGLNSWNPLWANIHVYWGMLCDSFRTRRWRDKLAIWWRRTAFLPMDIEKLPSRHGRRYDPMLSVAMRNYTLLQFIGVVLMGVWLKYAFSAMASAQAVSLFAYLLYSLLVLGWLLEGRGLWFECLRLLSLPLLVLWLYPQPVLLLPCLVVALCSLLWLQKNKRSSALPEGV